VLNSVDREKYLDQSDSVISVTGLHINYVSTEASQKFSFIKKNLKVSPKS